MMPRPQNRREPNGERQNGPQTNAQADVPADDFELVCMADVKPESIDWLWPDRFAVGKVSIIAGDPGLGKSTVTLDIAARVTRGYPWPDVPDEWNQEGSVILLSAEDGLADTIRPRLDAAEADVNRFYVLTTVRQRDGTLAPFNLKRDIPRIEQAIQSLGDVRLVIIDPISAYLGDTDDHKNGAVRGLLAPLAEMAERLKVAVILVSHLNKNMGGKSNYRVMGSLAFVAAARTVWMIEQDHEQPERRLMLRVKNNIAASLTGLAFSIVDGAIRWERDPIDLTADQALVSEEQPQTRRNREVDRAADFLREVLADGPVPSTEVYRQGRNAGFKEHTLGRAKDQAGIRVGRQGYGPGGHCYWELIPSPPSSPPGELDNYDEYDPDEPDEGRAEVAA